MTDQQLAIGVWTENIPERARVTRELTPAIRKALGLGTLGVDESRFLAWMATNSGIPNVPEAGDTIQKRVGEFWAEFGKVYPSGDQMIADLKAVAVAQEKSRNERLKAAAAKDEARVKDTNTFKPEHPEDKAESHNTVKPGQPASDVIKLALFTKQPISLVRQALKLPADGSKDETITAGSDQDFHALIQIIYEYAMPKQAPIPDSDFDAAEAAARKIAQDDLPPHVDPAQLDPEDGENDKMRAVRTAKECLDKCKAEFGYTPNEVLRIWGVDKLGDYGNWNNPETAGSAYYEVKNRFAFDTWLNGIDGVDDTDVLPVLGIAEWDLVDWTNEVRRQWATEKMKPHLETLAKKMADEKAAAEQKSLSVVNAPSTVTEIAAAPLSKATYWQKWMITPQQVCEHAVRSHLYRGITTADHAMAVVLTGLEIGISPMVALRQLPLINNVPTATAALQLAMLQRNGVRVEILVREANTNTIRMTRTDTGVVLEQTYTMADATRAGLTTPRGKDNPKSMYELYPKEMLTWANIRTMAKQIAADILLGLGLPLYTAEEMGADIDPITGELAAA